MVDIGKRVFAVLAAVFSAILLVLAAQKVTRNKKRADVLEQQYTSDTEQLIEADTEAAAAKIRKASEYRRRAADAESEAKARLDKIGESDANLADLVSDWNSGRLQQRSDETGSMG